MIADAESGNLKNVENAMAMKMVGAGDVGDALIEKVTASSKAAI